MLLRVTEAARDPPLIEWKNYNKEWCKKPTSSVRIVMTLRILWVHIILTTICENQQLVPSN
jgi:hypothetical protein